MGKYWNIYEKILEPQLGEFPTPCPSSSQLLVGSGDRLVEKPT